MFILDSLFVSGLRFVLDKVAVAADADQDDDTRLRESLHEAQVRLETGAITEREYVAIERQILDEVNAVRRRRHGDGPSAVGAYKVTGADVRVLDGDED